MAEADNTHNPSKITAISLPTHRRFKNLTGQRFGRWLVISYAGTVLGQAATWHCQCHCGTERLITGARLRRGTTKSCGYMNFIGPRSVHGRTNTQIYRAWVNMRTRCEDTKGVAYHRYGGRGIRVCERWHDFNNFLKDLGEPPTQAHSLERIDNNGNYEPGNCKWADRIEQANNKQNSIMITIDGITKSAGRWGKENGVAPLTIVRRLKKGCPREFLFQKGWFYTKTHRISQR